MSKRSTQTLFEQFLANFDGVRQTAENQWEALCPSHSDSQPSLAISLGKKGDVVMHCHAGCPTKEVLAEVGLTMSDLRLSAPSRNGNRKEVAQYDYCDATGKLVLQVLRCDPKGFWQRKPKRGGGWELSVKECEVVPYRLPELRKARLGRIVYIVEGEKDVERLRDRGFVATCNAGGAGNWTWEHAQHLGNRHVVIIPDNDVPGRKHAQHVARSLVGIAESIKIVELPDLAEKGDVSDWIDAGGTKQSLKRLVREADEWSPEISNNVIKIITPVLGEAAYHGLTGDFLRAVGPFTEATDAGLLAHWLLAVGTLVGSGVHVHKGGEQPARLNAVLVGRTNSGRKGTSFGPVSQLMNLVDATFWETQCSSGLQSGEGLIVKVADVRQKNEDGKWEVIPVEKRVFVIEPEFSRVLVACHRDTSILSHVMREAFDCGNLSTMTITPRHAVGAHINIVAHITPEELAARFTQVEMANGFGNRFMWFLVKSDKILVDDEPIPNKVFAPFTERLKSLLTLGDVNDKRTVPLDDEAKNYWRSIYEGDGGLREDRPGLAGAMAARGSSMVPRLALIYALLDDWKPKVIERIHLEAAMAVWRYCEESAQQLFGGQAGDTLANKLLSLLSDGPLAKDDFNRHLSAAQKRSVDGTLSRLEGAGQVRKTKEKQDGAGRPATVWERVT